MPSELTNFDSDQRSYKDIKIIRFFAKRKKICYQNVLALLVLCPSSFQISDLVQEITSLDAISLGITSGLIL